MVYMLLLHPPTGRILVDHYAQSALELLLPAIENGLLEDNWRIRQSSVKLLGKLLFKVQGCGCGSARAHACVCMWVWVCVCGVYVCVCIHVGW